MPYERLHNLSEIEQYLRRDVYLHLYGLGDLDKFFRPYVTWYGQRDGGELSSVMLVYHGPSLPTVLALSSETTPMAALLRNIEPELPVEFYAHLSPGLEEALAPTHALQARGPHRKMALQHLDLLPQTVNDGIAVLAPADADELLAFYRESYPDGWFDPRMLETGKCYCLRDGGRIVSAAGVHVYSPVFRVAALGNIATLPSHRNRGCARAVTAALCRALLDTVDHIGLNVKADNAPAIACYEQLGFVMIASYNEFTVKKL